MSKSCFKVPTEYYLARRAYLERELSKLPDLRKGVHEGRKVIRHYAKTKSGVACREISNRSSRWNDAEAILNKRCKITDELEKIKTILKNEYASGDYPEINLMNMENQYGSEFFDSVEDCSCNVKKDKNYPYGGRIYRSRAEMGFAEILDKYGLEFKYDVVFNVDGQLISVDFLILFREFNRCAFIEYCGICNKPSYSRHNDIKVTDARLAGIYQGRDLFIVDGDADYTPGADMMEIIVVCIIGLFCKYHIGIG